MWRSMLGCGKVLGKCGKVDKVRGEMWGVWGSVFGDCEECG